MVHAGHHEQFDSAVALTVAAGVLHDVLVVRDRPERAQRRVRPAVVQNQLAAARPQLRQIRTGRAELVHERLEFRTVAIECEGPPVERAVRALKREVFEIPVLEAIAGRHSAGGRERAVDPPLGRRRPGHPCLPSRRAILVPERKPHQRAAERAFQIAVNRVDGLDLRARQAIGAVRTRAFQRLGCEVARTWIRDESIGEPVQRITTLHHRVRQERDLPGREEMLRRRQQRLINKCASQLSQRAKRRIAGDDPVEVFRIALRLHQRLPSAIRTPIKIRVPWGRAIVRVAQGFGRDGRDVRAAVRVVDSLRGAVECPTRVDN